MKCFAAVALLALFAVAYAAEKPAEAPANIEAAPEQLEAAARDKRGVLHAAAYTAPVAYSAYTAPVAYSAYSYPYAYSASYRTYPYYSSYVSSPYIVG